MKSMVFSFFNTSAIADKYVTWWVQTMDKVQAKAEAKAARVPKAKVAKVKVPTDAQLDKLAMARMDDDGGCIPGPARKVSIISQETLAFWRRHQGQAEINLKALEVA